MPGPILWTSWAMISLELGLLFLWRKWAVVRSSGPVWEMSAVATNCFLSPYITLNIYALCTTSIFETYSVKLEVRHRSQSSCLDSTTPWTLLRHYSNVYKTGISKPNGSFLDHDRLLYDQLRNTTHIQSLYCTANSRKADYLPTAVD